MNNYTKTKTIEMGGKQFKLIKDYTKCKYYVEDETGYTRPVEPDKFEVITEVCEDRQNTTYKQYFDTRGAAESYMFFMKRRFGIIDKITINRLYRDDEGTTYPLLVYMEELN